MGLLLSLLMGLIQTHCDELFCSSEVGNLGEGGKVGSQASPDTSPLYLGGRPWFFLVFKAFSELVTTSLHFMFCFFGREAR